MSRGAAIAWGVGGAAALAAVVFAMRRARAAAPPARCAMWVVPSPVPRAIALRARQILESGAVLGQRFVEPWNGQLWMFVVETHGPSAQIPTPHKGVGVRVCSTLVTTSAPS